MFCVPREWSPDVIGLGLMDCIVPEKDSYGVVHSARFKEGMCNGAMTFGQEENISSQGGSVYTKCI